MKIALYGGRFDPIHNGHVAVAQEVLKVGGAEEVWFSVENQHQWRPIVASADDRKRMLELAIEEVTEKGFSTSFSNGGIRSNKKMDRDSIASLQNDMFSKMRVDITPVDLGGLTETLKVVRKVREKYPQHTFIFIVGSDQLETFPKWTHWEDLQKEVQFLVVARKGFPLENIPANASVINDPTYEPLEDSATRVRERLKRGESIEDLVPKKVAEYIKEKGLYK